MNGPDGVIKHTQSLIAQEGSRQFSDRDRATERELPSMVLTEYAKGIARSLRPKVIVLRRSLKC